MSTLKTTYVQHPDAVSPAIELTADGTVALPLSDLEDLNNVSGTPTDGQILAFGTATSTWNPTDPSGGFDSSVTITATDSSWSVPASADGIFRVTAVGGGGGGGGGKGMGNGSSSNGGTGGTTIFGSGAAYAVSATGGTGGTRGATTTTTKAATAGLAAGNGGTGGNVILYNEASSRGGRGSGGRVVVAYVDLSGVSTVNVVIGSGGAAGAGAFSGANGAAGGRGEVIVEYRAA